MKSGAATGRLNHLSAVESIRLIQRGEVTAKAILDDCLAQVRRLEPELQAWVHVASEAAHVAAQAIDETIRTGVEVGRLAGVPVGIKDIFNTRDMPTQMGSPIWRGFTPGNDARAIHSVRMAGAVLLGKTVTAEFAVHTPGPTRNPHDLRCTPGTSSSGSAAAVAAYMVPLALGSQTAGSTLRPASYCGIYGFKPSFGLIPRTGMLKTTDSLDTVGLFARTVEDLALLFDAVRVHGPDYPVSHAMLDGPRRQSRGARPWKVALVRGPKWMDAEAYARAALGAYAERLTQEPEVVVEEATLPESFFDAHAIHGVIYDKALSYYFKTEFRQHALISPLMYEIIARGNEIPPERYQEALRQQDRLAGQFDEFMQRYDALVTLTTGGAAQEGLDVPDRLDTCLIWTLCGAPAINIPVFSTPARMPFGAQFVSRRYNDRLLLEFVRFLRNRGLTPEATNPSPSLATDAHQ